MGLSPHDALMQWSPVSHPIMQEDVRRPSACVTVRKKSFTGKFKLTYSELFFSAKKHAGYLKILTAAQRAGIFTSDYKPGLNQDFKVV